MRSSYPCLFNFNLRTRIELDEPESNDLRRYFEGAIVPQVCESWDWCDPTNRDDLNACRELLKAEFNGRWVPTPSGGKRKVAMSTKTQKVLRPFLNRVVDWMAEQGIPIPNPELYKLWQKSAPLVTDGSYRDWLERQGMKPDETVL
jgi:hypothetical protein